MAEFLYEVKEALCCFSNQDNKWYEAKIIKRKAGSQGRPHSYFVHYKGWKKEWDEWVEEGIRLSRGSTDDLQRKFHRDFLQIQLMSSKQKCKHKNAVRIPSLSLEIKESLVAQHQMICEYPMLWVDLPKARHLTVNGLCKEFETMQRDKIKAANQTNPDAECLYMNQTMASIRFYFNQFLSVNILFETERAQKALLDRKWLSRRGKLKGGPYDIDYCDIYGAEHLFRLLFHLPRIYNNVKQWDNPMQPAKITNYVTLFQGFLGTKVGHIAANFNLNENMGEYGLVEQCNTL